MSLVEHAKIELEAAGMFKDNYDMGIAEGVLQIVDTFAKQGHSGFSAAITVDILNKLLRYEPLCPLTGKPEEWTHVCADEGGEIYQNKRCSHVFARGPNGEDAWDIEGIVFKDPVNNQTWTNRDSRVAVTFPYKPTKKYVTIAGKDQSILT